ncbi:hypothetical protein [Amycolatopsis sp. cmx-4-61]|uniref:hypothetical protein n=1 Tax=Amycolatopsis sp. cmx-4-61 TaxID=2790937 RepID=UPI00397DFA45
MAFAPDGHTTFLAAKSTGTIDQWEITDSTVRVHDVLPNTPAVYAVAIVPAGLVASGAEDGAVRLWTTPAPAPLPGRLADRRFANVVSTASTSVVSGRGESPRFTAHLGHLRLLGHRRPEPARGSARGTR